MRVFLLFDVEPFVLEIMSEVRKEGCAPLFEKDWATAERSGRSLPFICQIIGLSLVTVACFFSGL